MSGKFKKLERELKKIKIEQKSTKWNKKIQN